MIHSTQTVLRFEHAVRDYESAGQTVRALGPIDLEIRKGEFLAIMGPSGSGKSTLLSLAGALDHPTAGRVLFEEHDLAHLSVRKIAEMRRRRLGYVFQELNLLPGLTALENVALPMELDGESPKGCREQAQRSLDGVGIGELAHRFPEDLSGGEQQRVAIARSFVGGRSVLLADEPTGALDSVTGERILRLLHQHCKAGKTVILVTHDSSHAAWADRVLFLRDGEILDESTAPSAATVPLPGPTGLAPRTER
ncbi:MAG: ABC transporter ATP-binding protein [Acidobacteriota bacterium]